MPIGPYVRTKLGRFERPATDLYRSMFVNLGEFLASTRTVAKSPGRVLEVGCGTGIVTELLAAAFPDAEVTGIDVCEAPGTLCSNRSDRVRFLRMTAAELSATHPDPYQLVVICDVLHHVPPRDRVELLTCVRELVGAGGVLVLKEWIRQQTLPYLMGYLSDRFITGDDIRYMSEQELRAMAARVFGAESVQSDFRVGPWNCNLALVIRP